MRDRNDSSVKEVHTQLHIYGTDHGTYDIMSSDSDLEWQQAGLRSGLIDVKMDFQSVAFKRRDSESPVGVAILYIDHG